MSAGTNGIWCVISLPTTPAVAAIAVMPSELPMVTRTGMPTTTTRSGTSRNPPPAPTNPAARPTPPATTAIRSGLNLIVASAGAGSSSPPGSRIRTAPTVARIAKTTSSHVSSTHFDARAPTNEPAMPAKPPIMVSCKLIARCRRCARKPDTAATNTSAIVTPTTSLTASWPTPSSGGT